MNTLFTYPQLIHSLTSLAALFISAVAIGTVFYLRNKDLRSKTSQNKLRREVSELSGDLADLSERFSRFQKREGMRAAREEKLSARDLTLRAEEIVAQGASQAAGNSGVHPKAGLYKQRRN